MENMSVKKANKELIAASGKMIITIDYLATWLKKRPLKNWEIHIMIYFILQLRLRVGQICCKNAEPGVCVGGGMISTTAKCQKSLEEWKTKMSKSFNQLLS